MFRDKVLAVIGSLCMGSGVGAGVASLTDIDCMAATQVQVATYALCDCSAIDTTCDTQGRTCHEVYFDDGSQRFSFCSCNEAFDPRQPGATPVCFRYRIGIPNGAGAGCTKPNCPTTGQDCQPELIVSWKRCLCR
jgi:hypothetical protein